MAAVIGIVLVSAAYALVLGLLMQASRRMRRGGAGSGVIGPFEEIWHPAAHRARLENEVQVVRTVPAPDPGDQTWTGSITLRRYSGSGPERAEAGRP